MEGTKGSKNAYQEAQDKKPTVSRYIYIYLLIQNIAAINAEKIKVLKTFDTWRS